MSDANRLRRQLASQLTAAGHLRTDPWRRAVETVPRHTFLTGGFFKRIDAPGRPTAWTPVMPDDDSWLQACYSDNSLVTQIAGTIIPGDLHGQITRLPTSSSTLPSLVVRMLEDLQVEDGHRLLLIGLGTGYSSGLACHRLGSDHVTAIEIDPDVASRARNALGLCGYTPTVIVGDGLTGWKEGGRTTGSSPTAERSTSRTNGWNRQRPAGSSSPQWAGGCTPPNSPASGSPTRAPLQAGSWTAATPSCSPAPKPHLHSASSPTSTQPTNNPRPSVQTCSKTGTPASSPNWPLPAHSGSH